MNKKLVRYVQATLHQGFSLQHITERLRAEGWPEEDIQRSLAFASQHHLRKARFLIALAGFLILLIAGVLAYLFVLAPAFVEKPELQRPALISQSIAPGVAVIDASHITYVLNELGMYKLHANPFTGDIPEVEIVLTDLQQTFTAGVENNLVSVRHGAAANPDARVKVTQEAVVTLATAPEAAFSQRALQLFSEREQRGYTAKLLTSEQDLVLKGYLALYEEHQATVEAAGVTGSTVLDLPLLGSAFLGMFVIILLLWGALLLRMAFGDR